MRRLTGRSLAALAPDPVVLTGAATQTVTSGGGSPAVSKALNAAYTAPLCAPLPATAEPGTAVYKLAVHTAATTVIGAPTVRARITVTGRYPELVGRLWDVSPAGTRQIVALGVVRPSVNQAPGTSPTAVAGQTVSFQLDPTDYSFAPGDTIELELVGSTAPLFRKSNGRFSIAVSGLRLTLPTT